MRNLALADVTDNDLRQMRSENETLFVEYKSTLDGEGYKIAEAVASFANTLGGWVLVGLGDDGTPSGWSPPNNVTDRVRQILDRWLDPLPAFAARVREHEGDEIGLVRVYESTDTPHVLANGKVVVRSVAESQNKTKYVPGGVDTQIVLRQLADRGRRAAEEAESKFGATATPLIQHAFGMGPLPFPTLTSNHVVLRAVPLVGDALRDLAVSSAGRALLDGALRDLAGFEDGTRTLLRPAASGLVCEIEPRSALLDGVMPIPRTAVAAADAAGVVAMGFRFHVASGTMRTPGLSLDHFRDGIIAPLLSGVVGILERAELFGRSLFELRIGNLTDVITYGNEDERPLFPADLPLGGEISLPLDATAPELGAVADQWRDDLGRAMGFETLRP